MANNTFELIAKLSLGKESEKFKPYEIKTSEKGWVTTRLIFNAVAGTNRHMLEVKGGYFKDGNSKIYAFTKGSVNENGEKIKGEKLEIPWKDRANPEIVEKVAEFKKFVVDLEEYNRRYKLEKLAEKFKDGDITDEEMLELGVEEPLKALEDSKKKRKEFIAESDFAEYIYKLISSGKVNDRLFRITGEIVYSEYNNKFYKRLVPTRIYLAEKDAVASSTGQLTVFFNKESLDSNSLKDNKKYYINGYIRNYDNQRKTDIPCPVQLVIDTSKDDVEMNRKLNLAIVKQFTVKDKSLWKELGVKVKLLDGSQKIEISEEHLTDFQKEMLEIGAITLDDIRREIGKDLYGERVQEMVVVNVARGYTSGSKDTVFSNQDFEIKPIELVETITKKKQDEDENIFDLDLDIEI